MNPERPWPALDALARRHRGRRQDARAAPHRVPRVRARPRALACTPTCAFAGARARPTPKGSRATTRGAAGGDDRAARAAAGAVLPDRTARGRAVPSARCSTACSPAKRSASTRSSRCSAHAGPTSPGSRRSPTSSAATPSATPSRSSATATSTTRTSARSSAGSARSRRVRSRSTCAATRTSSSSRRSSARVVEAVECGATEVCLQGGIHPDFDGDYYLDVARAVKEVAPDIHVHGFTALEVTEGRAPARHAAARLPRAG